MPAASSDTPINYLPFDFTCSCGAQGTILNISKQSLLTQASPRSVPQRRERLKQPPKGNLLPKRSGPQNHLVKPNRSKQIKQDSGKQTWMGYAFLTQGKRTPTINLTILSGGKSALALTVPYRYCDPRQLKSNLLRPWFPHMVARKPE